MGVRRIAYHGCPCYETRVCESPEESAECQELMYVLLTGSYYGARDVGMIRKWLGPARNHVYLGAYSKQDGSLQGTFRLIQNYNPTIYSNLYDHVVKFCHSGQRLIDVGAYISPFKKEKPSIFEALFTLTIQYMITGEINGVYIQVKENEVETYTGLGFIPASDPFQPTGWRSRWRAMLMRIDEIIPQLNDRDFQSAWLKQTSVPFRCSFWQRVMTRINACQEWVIAEN